LEVLEMGVRIIDNFDGEAAIYDSVSMTAFGPIFKDTEQAEAFLKWLVVDARRVEECDLMGKYSEFLDKEAEIRISDPNYEGYDPAKDPELEEDTE
jgi:hypothetical protein